MERNEDEGPCVENLLPVALNRTWGPDTRCDSYWTAAAVVVIIKTAEWNLLSFYQPLCSTTAYFTQAEGGCATIQ